MKYRHIIIAALAGCCAAVANAQTQNAQSSAWGDALLGIVHNNSTLKAARSQLQASRLANGTTLKLPDPEAEVAYLFGSPQGVPNRTNVSVTQTLDWGVLTGRRKQLAGAGNQVAEAAYRQAEQQLLAEADQTLTSVVYYNKLCTELAQRAALANEVCQLYQQKFAQGGINQIEVNKVKLNASVSQAELERARNERQELLLQLQRLNGGQPLELADTCYPNANQPLPALADLQSAVAQSPALLAAQAAVAQQLAEVKLAKAEALPALMVGFQGEYIKDNNYSGLSLGFSLPLWGNTRRKVKQAKAEVVARQLDADDVRHQQSSQLMQQ
ncbi:TolC family protein, partial [Prevotellamassilia timonensis]|uniref:TolC family protein n=1 Tax=Prevotellamassilia timonensis TaxID=1852370 RepID=UPI00307BB079